MTCINTWGRLKFKKIYTVLLHFLLTIRYCVQSLSLLGGKVQMCGQTFRKACYKTYNFSKSNEEKKYILHEMYDRSREII